MPLAGLHRDCTTPWPSVRNASRKAHGRCRTAHGAPGSAAQSCRAPDKTRPIAGTRCVVLSGGLGQMLSRLGTQRRGTGRQPGLGLSARELYGAASPPPADRLTCWSVSPLTLRDRDCPLWLLRSGTQRARRPLRPELRALLGGWLSAQLASAADGRASWWL